MLLSIIIKTLNEEVRVESAIQSALDAISELGGDGEVILADSLSTDQTIEIAKRYPIRIVQLAKAADRSCGVGAEIGYRVCNGEFIYILDGDMTLCKGFIATALDKLKRNQKLAGVAGLVEEMVLTNSAMIGRKEKAENSTPSTSVICLNMGGLYRRVAIEQVGYLTNRNLHSFEEFELGVRLTHAGWELERIDYNSIKHFGPDCSSIKLLIRRWNTLYACGNGELFREILGKPYFWKAILNLRIYRIQLATLLLWLALIVNLIVTSFSLFGYLAIVAAWACVFCGLAIVKRSISKALYSISAWHIGLLGFFRGIVLAKKPSPTTTISFLTIK